MADQWACIHQAQVRSHAQCVVVLLHSCLPVLLCAVPLGWSLTQVRIPGHFHGAGPGGGAGGQPAPQGSSASRSVFVGNIPYTASEDQLQEVFETAGPVFSLRCQHPFRLCYIFFLISANAVQQ